MDITVARALETGGLQQGEVIAGHAHLANVIENVNILEAPWEPDWVVKNQLYLTSFYAIRDDIQKQVDTVRSLAGNNCAGLVFQTGILDSLDQRVIDQANRSGLPLIQITDAVDYSKIIAPLVGAILQEKTFLLQRAQKIHRLFTDISLKGGGLPAIVTTLNELIQQPVAIVNAWGDVLAGDWPENSGDFVAGTLNVGEVSSDESQIGPVYHPAGQFWRLPLLLVGKDTPEGFVVVHDPDGQANPMKLTAIEQAGAVATIELVKQQAVLETERRLQRDFLEDLLTGEYQSTEAMVARARSLGWDLLHKRVVLLVEIDHFEQYYLTHIKQGENFFQQIKARLFETVARVALAHNTHNILVDRSDSIIVLPHFAEETPLPLAQRTTHSLAKNLHSETNALLTGLDVSVSIGSFYNTVGGLRHSYREARAALAAGRRLSTQQGIIWYEDVALYVLLNRFAHQPEVQRWVEMTLGKLITYDGNNSTDLVKTLETYFDANQVSQQSAQTLFIHPKTLKYRLRRIEEILGESPFEGDRQLSFYLATKLIRFI